MSPEVMAEYLVKLSADIDTNSFNSAMMAINQLSAKLKSMKGGIAMAALGSGLAKVGTAAVGLVKDVAKADLEFTKLGQRMWVTKDTAKALSVAMKTMGCTEEDIAWVPELREQFFRLRNEMNELATPKDAEDGLKFVRNIGYEIESLQVKLKKLKEWVVYYLLKIIRPFMEEFREWVKWLNGKLKGRMPDIAKTIAKWLGYIVSLASSALKAFRKIGESIYNFFERMPESAKKWGAILAGVGAFVMASPLGRLITVLGGALVLLEDFIYYCNGWNSSKTLAPVWQKIIDFLESDTLANVKETVLGFLGTAGEMFDKIWEKLVEIGSYILDGIDWDSLTETWSNSIGALWDGICDLYNELAKLFEDFAKWTGIEALSSQKAFWKAVGSVISGAFENLMKLAGVVGKVFKAVACALRGDFAGAFSAVKDAVLDTGDVIASVLSVPIGLAKSVGDAIVNFAKGNYKEGDQWMGKVTKDSRIQCDSWAADVYAKTQIMPHKEGQIMTAEDWKAGNAYHPAGDGYMPHKGDYIDGKGHVGIYLGDGKYMARNSSGGIHTGTMEEWNHLFGAPIGYGSVAQYVAFKQQEKQREEQEAYQKRSGEEFFKGAEKYASNFDNGRRQYGMWTAHNSFDWIKNGADNAAGARSFQNSFTAAPATSQVSYGDVNVNVNVAGTNATANDIANATAKKIIAARMNKGVTV